MKIIFDKLKPSQEYAISGKEIKLLFGLIPELSQGIKIVHVQNQPPFKTRFPRPVRYELLSSKIIISAHELPKDEIIKEILVELISKRGNDATLRPASFRSLSKKQLQTINEMVEPILLEFKETSITLK